MLKKTVTYTDYNDNTRTEDFYFNLTKAELTEMNLSTTGGLEQMIRDIIAAQDTPKIIAIFKELLLKSYGVKSADGRRFIKSKELSTEFSQTEAFPIIYMELLTDEGSAEKFMTGILPSDMQGTMQNALEESNAKDNNSGK
jgi:hypothetical protein